MNNRERITVTNTAIMIDDYDLGSCPDLEKYFQVWDPVRHKRQYFGLYYDSEMRRLYLPSGMDLWYVRRCLGENYYHRELNHNYDTIGDVLLKYKPRDAEQLEALRFLCDAGDPDLYNTAQGHIQYSLNLNTGKGKTFTAIASVCFYKVKSIVITGSNTLLSQWQDNILEYTNLEAKDVFQITGSQSCNGILNGTLHKAKDAKIILCSHGTLRSFGDTYGWDKVYDLFEFLGIGIKIFDEFHTNYKNMMMIDFFTNVWKTFYLSATPNRSNEAENKVFVTSIKNVPAIDLFNEEKDPHTHYMAIKWNSCPTPQQISYCSSRMYGLDRNRYMDYLTRKPEFYDMLHIIVSEFIKPIIFSDKPGKRGRVLVYIGTNDGILRVYKWICDHYPEFIGDIGIFTSLLSKEEKMKDRGKKLLLSTTKSAGLGEHINNLKMTIVLAEPFKSEVLARQTLGRTRDPDTYYLELVDMGFKYTKNFYYKKLPVFKKYAVDESNSMVDKYELQKRSSAIKAEKDAKWQHSPIRMDDKRFDFSNIKLPGELIDPNQPHCPVIFHNVGQTERFGRL